MIMYFGGMRKIWKEFFQHPKKKHLVRLPDVLFSFYYCSRSSDERNVWDQYIKRSERRRKKCQKK